MYGRRGYGYEPAFQPDIIEEVLEVEAVEDLLAGNVGGFVEDELLADFL